MERVWFNSRRGERLAGVLHRPKGTPRRGMILTHGFRGSKEGGGKAVELAEQISDRGLAVLRFDFAGVGESEGEFDRITLSRQVADLQGALDWFLGTGPLDTFVVGRSFGGSTALAAAALDQRIRGLCLWSTPIDLVATFRRTLGGLFEQLEAGREVSIRDDHGEGFGLRPEFVTDAKRHDLYRDLERVAGRPILFLHGEGDETVSLEQAEQGYQVAGHPKELVVIKGGDHQFTRTWESAWQALFSWIEKLPG
ncbi:MAG: alpha/beta hydrolase [Firmicutes bacterium]|nr:alpha/beta hydrolase [Bacillota bacterium]